MSNSRRIKDKKVHASYQGSGFRLCNVRKRGSTSSVAEEITCEACGQAARRLMKALDAEHHKRQEAALAAKQPSHWWEAVGGTDGPRIS